MSSADDPELALPIRILAEANAAPWSIGLSDSGKTVVAIRRYLDEWRIEEEDE